METSFIASIFIFCGTFNPRGFFLCMGQLLSIAENSTLYTLIGTTYGGDGQTTFGLPDLRGRTPIGQGQGPGLSNYVMGQMSGTESITLTQSQMPAHTHLINVSSAAATSGTPSTNSFLGSATAGSTPEKLYTSAAANTTMSSQSVSMAGGSQPFSILQPLLAVNYIIAANGVFPSQN